MSAALLEENIENKIKTLNKIDRWFLTVEDSERHLLVSW